MDLHAFAYLYEFTAERVGVGHCVRWSVLVATRHYGTGQRIRH
jgi:hypothetical protein